MQWANSFFFLAINDYFFFVEDCNVNVSGSGKTQDPKWKITLYPYNQTHYSSAYIMVLLKHPHTWLNLDSKEQSSTTLQFPQDFNNQRKYTKD